MNSHIRRLRMNVKWRIDFRKMTNAQLHIHKIADKRATYNEGRLYRLIQYNILLFVMYPFHLRHGTKMVIITYLYHWTLFKQPI
jgi:hypothetical protein